MVFKIALIYTTWPSHEEAVQVARQAIADKEAACVHVGATGVSVYEWEGKHEESAECLVLFKTPLERKDQLVEWIRKHHPYKVPALMVVEAETTEDFLRYVEAQTEEQRSIH